MLSEKECYLLQSMSLAELKQAVETLSAEERDELSAHLWLCARRADPTWREEITRRLDQAQAAPTGSSKPVLERIHQRLKGEGR